MRRRGIRRALPRGRRSSPTAKCSAMIWPTRKAAWRQPAGRLQRWASGPSAEKSTHPTQHLRLRATK
eukprot:7732932-Alexandrium_andersonii.AAC.1